MAFLRQSAYVSIEHIEQANVVRVVRTSEPFGDASAARFEVGEWARAVSRLDAADLGILLDFRLTPMTSDPDILREVVLGTNTLARRFVRQAVLLSAALAAPQAERVTRAGGQLRTFSDEAAAWRHVSHVLPS